MDRIFIDVRHTDAYINLCECTKYDEIFHMEYNMLDANKREDLNILERYINAYEQYRKSDFYVTTRKNTTTLDNNLNDYQMFDFIQEASRLVENGGTDGFKNKYNKEPDPNISRNKYENKIEDLMDFIKDKQIVLLDNGLIHEDMFAVFYQELYCKYRYSVKPKNKAIILYLKFYSADEKRRWLNENPFINYINEELNVPNFVKLIAYRYEVFASLRNKNDDTKNYYIDRYIYENKIISKFNHFKQKLCSSINLKEYFYPHYLTTFIDKNHELPKLKNYSFVYNSDNLREVTEVSCLFHNFFVEIYLVFYRFYIYSDEFPTVNNLCKINIDVLVCYNEQLKGSASYNYIAKVDDTPFEDYYQIEKYKNEFDECKKNFDTFITNIHRFFTCGLNKFDIENLSSLGVVTNSNILQSNRNMS